MRSKQIYHKFSEIHKGKKNIYFIKILTHKKLAIANFSILFIYRFINIYLFFLKATVNMHTIDNCMNIETSNKFIIYVYESLSNFFNPYIYIDIYIDIYIQIYIYVRKFINC